MSTLKFKRLLFIAVFALLAVLAAVVVSNVAPSSETPVVTSDMAVQGDGVIAPALTSTAATVPRPLQLTLLFLTIIAAHIAVWKTLTHLGNRRKRLLNEKKSVSARGNSIQTEFFIETFPRSHFRNRPIQAT